MQRTLNRTLSLLLAVVMVLSMIPVIASAAGETPVAEAVAVNTVTGEQYADVSDALKSATEGQTIKLISDAQDTSVTVRPNTKLDLNGNKLECKYYFCYGATVDNSAANTGLLVPSRVVFSGTNEQIAIHNGTGYQFFQVQGFNTKEIEGGKFVFQPLFEEGALELLANGMDASGVKIEVHVGYRMGGFDKTAIFYFSDALVNAYLESYADGKFGQMFTLSISNAAEFGKLTFTPAVSSTAGITITPAQISVDENGQLTEDVTLQNGQNSAVVGAGTLLEGGNLTLTTTTLTESQAEVELGAEETLTSLDVHVEGLAKDNTVPVLVTLTQIAPESLNKGNIHLYHVEDGKTVEMTRVYSLAELDAHNEFYYDIPTGTVTVALCSFSEIAVRSSHPAWEGGVDHTWYDADAEKLYIYNADQLWSLSQIVGGMTQDKDGNPIVDENGNTIRDDFAGKTIVLYADIDLADTEEDGKIFYPIGYWNDEGTYEKSGNAISSGFYAFKGIFDGNGHTISNFYQNTWEMKGDHNWYAASAQNYRDGMGLFGKVYGGTVKNLTVENFSSDGEIATTGTIAAYADCGATFENITIFNCNPRVYNIGNGGIVGCVGWYNNEETDENPVTFKNITVDNSNKISALWGSYDVACGGLVGQYYPTSGQSNATDNAGIYMENCHVAAQIDVYNDVCGNYMYYAYRYAGMLVGSVRENVVGEDGREYPNVEDISAKDCTVHYGEWNHYYYCEFEKNGHPSYAQADEYKFSRVPESELVRDEDGKVIGCTHEHTDVEDNRAVYLPFYDQLVTGYGWGVTSKGIADITGVKVLDREIADSEIKFDAVKSDNSEVKAGEEFHISDIFAAAEDMAGSINDANVKVFASPVEEGTNVSAVFAASSDSNWKNGKIIFSGKGLIQVSITDYYYCTTTTVILNVVDAYTRTVSFSVPKDVNAVTSLTGSTSNAITLPSAGVPDADDGKVYSFVGWTIEAIAEADATTTAPTIYAAGDEFFPEEDTKLYALYTYDVTEGGSEGTTKYELTDINEITSSDEVVITMTTSNGTVYALSSGNGTSAAPTAVKITVNGNVISSNVADELVWNIANSSEGLTIYPNGTTAKWLYTTNTNDGTRVGTNANKIWTLDATSGYLKNTATSRYLGVYTTKPDWRSYNNTTGNTAGQTLGFFVKTVIPGEGGTTTTWYVTEIGACLHTSTTLQNKEDATCTTAGYTGDTYCNDCDELISTGSVIDAPGHNFEGENCTVCGTAKPNNAQITDASTILAGGDFVIVAKNSDNKYYALGGSVDSNKIVAIEVQIREGYVVVNEGITLWTVAPINETTFSLKLDDKYLNHNAKTGLSIDSTGTNWKLATGSADNSFRINSAISNWGSRALAYRYSTGVFGPYATSNAKDSDYVFDLYIYQVATVSACEHNYEVTETMDATCTTAGSKTETCSLCGDEKITPIAAKGHTEVIDAAVAATCKDTGLTEGKHCSVCEKVLVAQVEVPVIDHNYVEGTCDACGAKDPDYKPVTIKEITFNLGANGSASHSDGSEKTTYGETVDGYTLTLSNMSKVYTGARDAKGNSCLKLGTGSAVGKFSFTVPSDVTSVDIMIAKYKDESTQVAVNNGSAQSLTKNSNNGEYDVITIDTTTTKTITISTTSSGKRAMVNTIVWKVTNNSGNEGGETPDALTATLSFADTAQRTSFSTSQQVWAQNGITFTNDKGSSTSNVANYYNPVRCYASSKITIEHTNTTKIVFNCQNSSHATALKNSIGTTATVSVSDTTVTVTFGSAVDTFTIAKLTAQVQIKSIEITYSAN